MRMKMIEGHPVPDIKEARAVLRLYGNDLEQALKSYRPRKSIYDEYDDGGDDLVSCAEKALELIRELESIAFFGENGMDYSFMDFKDFHERCMEATLLEKKVKKHDA
jgi:hypothetical protein